MLLGFAGASVYFACLSCLRGLAGVYCDMFEFICTLLLPGALQLPACHMFYFVEAPALAIEALQLAVCDLFYFVGDAAIFNNAIKALQLPVCGSCCCLPGFVLLEFCVFELIL